MSATILGLIDWSLSRDADGFRTYNATLRAKTDDLADGPSTVLDASGFPLVGSTWAYGNDIDSFVWLRPELEIRPQVTGPDPTYYWEVDLTYSNKPYQRCQDTQVEDPLLEPAKISGSFVKYTTAAFKDKDGDAIKSSSHEQIIGIERDGNRPTVVIEQNFGSLGLSTFAAAIDTVNDATLWGLPARTIKLSNVAWSRNIYGTCGFYYTRRYEFDINFNTFDIKDAVDAGFKKYGGSGSRSDPTNFVVAKDDNDENSPTRILLDGNGDPLTDATSPVFINSPDGIQLYSETNMLALGIPPTLA